jgi:DNA polymerase type B, organellar and viral
MPRPYRYRLQRNHTSFVPRLMVFLDTETSRQESSDAASGWYNVFRLATASVVRFEQGHVVSRNTKRFSATGKVWEWLEALQSKHRPLWVFAHNLSFDFKILGGWDQLDGGAYTVGPIPGKGADPRVKGERSWLGKLVLERSPFFMYLMGRNGRVNFVDSYNYFPRSLAKVGAAHGLPKEEWPGFDSSEDSLFAYCERDVEVLENAVIGAIKRWWDTDQGVWQPTASSLALHSFQHQDPASAGGKLVTKIIFEEDAAAIRLERDAYIGGHFEAFYHGDISRKLSEAEQIFRRANAQDLPLEMGPIHHLDVNGLYPYIMSARHFPVRRIAKLIRPRVDEFTLAAASGNALAHVTIHSPDVCYPVKLTAGQCHCCGTFATTLCGPELGRALNLNHVKTVHYGILYEMEPIFKDWVLRWHAELVEARRDEDWTRAEFAKLMLVSLSGKWAQKSRRWVLRPKIAPVVRWGDWIQCDLDDDPVPGEDYPVRKFRAVAGYAQECVDEGIPRHCFPAISAFITSYGREYMRHLRSLCPERSIYYQAADSLIARPSAFEALVDNGHVSPDLLGKLKVEGVYEDGSICSVNHYRIGSRLVVTGAYARAVRGEHGQLRGELWENIGSTLRSKPDRRVYVSQIPLANPRPHYKATPTKSGWTIPFNLDAGDVRVKRVDFRV